MQVKICYTNKACNETENSHWRVENEIPFFLLHHFEMQQSRYIYANLIHVYAIIKRINLLYIYQCFGKQSLLIHLELTCK